MKNESITVKIKALCLILLVLALTGCPKKVPVSERVVLQRDTKLPRVVSDQLDVAALNAAEDTKGIQLKPGDVIYLRRMFPNTYDPSLTKANTYHLTTPANYFDRIPLRYVSAKFITGSAETAPPALYPNEREFLATVLTVNRSCLFGKTDKETGHKRLELANFLQKHEATIWNYLVDTLKVKRLSVGGNEPNLVITFSIDVLFESLMRDPATRDEAKTYRPLFNPEPKCDPSVLAAQESPMPTGSPTPETATTTLEPARDREILGQEALFATPWKAITSSDKYEANVFYYAVVKPITGIPTITAFNFVTVEFSGINLRAPEYPETQWTLGDLQRSGVCLDMDPNVWPTVHKIFFVQDRHSYEVVLDGGERGATYSVRLMLNQENRPLRQIMRNEDADKTCRRCRRILLSDLEKIYLEDVRKIQWTVNTGLKSKKQPASLINPNNCLSK